MSISLPQFRLSVPEFGVDSDVYPLLNKYADKKSCAIQLMSDEGPLMTFSVAMDTPSGDWSFWAKTRSENESFIQPVLQSCKWMKQSNVLMPAGGFGSVASKINIDTDQLTSDVIKSVAKLMNWKIPGQELKKSASKGLSFA